LKENKYISVSLLHDTEHDGRSFLSLFISILLHLLIAGGIVFAPQYIPAYSPNPGFPPSSVINVSMVTLPAEEGLPDTNAKDNVVPEKNTSESEEPEPVNSSEPEEAEETVTVVEPEKTEEAVVVEPEKPEEAVVEPEKPEKTVVIEPEKPKEVVVPKPEKLKEKKPKFEKPKIVEKLKEKPEPPKKDPPKKDKTPDKRVAAKSKEPESDRVSGAPKDAIERIRQSLKKSSTVKESGIGSGYKGTGTGSGGGEGTEFGGGSGGGFGSIFGRKDSDALRFYRENVIPDAVNRNWAFSESMTHRRFNLEAVIVIRIMPNGEITDIWFEKKSGDKYFDDSAYKAVIKSNPLPSLPVGCGPYKVGLKFTPSGMK